MYLNMCSTNTSNKPGGQEVLKVINFLVAEYIWQSLEKEQMLSSLLYFSSLVEDVLFSYHSCCWADWKYNLNTTLAITSKCLATNISINTIQTWTYNQVLILKVSFKGPAIIYKYSHVMSNMKNKQTN